ncbi:hypothetical protein AG1IA_01547 [Rhizoctonia solani AG-1 IA]|uniref:Uncharacterized protein n=1 Tax=Thanatephorus cucumeris (strain AG1-IA) TaxID=983506 RepID=L8X279_THACA|nr:hypothetical protein AG1IA_01547 [Rhizoctonia solani AG-1 IA]
MPSLLLRLREKPIVIYTLSVFLGFVGLFMIYVSTIPPGDMNLKFHFKSKAILQTMTLPPIESAEKMPATGLNLLVPCVPRGYGLEVGGREFKRRLRACGSITTAVFAYHLSTLKRVTPLDAFKCKIALAYHVSQNPLPP